MKVKIDVDGDGKDDVSLEVDKAYGKYVVAVVAALASACTGVNLFLL